MRIFNSKGELITYNKETDPEMFKAVAASFGCFGVVFDMTIVLEPETIVKTENKYVSLGAVLDESYMKNLVQSNWSVELFWFPFNSFNPLPFFHYDPKKDDVWMRLINKETNSVKTKGALYYAWKDAKDLATQKALSVVGPWIAGYPSLTPYYEWSAFETLKHVIYNEGALYQELPNAIHFR